MQTAVKNAEKNQLKDKLKKSGLKLTRQRKLVYDILKEKPDHPTADTIFIRARKKQPDISFATVYNCLEALVRCGLIKQVKVDKTATRYCLNLTKHAHFVCEICGRVFDINMDVLEKLGCNNFLKTKLPDGFEIKELEVSIRGECNKCKIG
jgi:Fur family peroxide stress response transcriptional regulator